MKYIGITLICLAAAMFIASFLTLLSEDKSHSKVGTRFIAWFILLEFLSIGIYLLTL